MAGWQYGRMAGWQDEAGWLEWHMCVPRLPQGAPTSAATIKNLFATGTGGAVARPATAGYPRVLSEGMVAAATTHFPLLPIGYQLLRNNDAEPLFIWAVDAVAAVRVLIYIRNCAEAQLICLGC